MKKLMHVFLAAVFMFGITFVGEAISSNGSLSVKAQQVTVRKKRRPGIIRGSYRGGKWVVRKSWDGTKWVSKKVWQGTKWTGRNTWKTGRKVVSRTKKIVY